MPVSTSGANSDRAAAARSASLPQLAARRAIAVAQAQLFEIKSADILQPGIGALTDGLDQLAALIRQWAQS